MSTKTLPTYPWFDVVPNTFKTKSQLAAEGLRPSGPVRARVVWRNGRRQARLYDVAEAQPKRQLSEAQRAVLAKGRETIDRNRRT